MSETKIIADAELDTLRCLAGHLIPASPRHGVPGADDPAIFADIAGSMDRDASAVREALVVIDGLAGGRLTQADPVRQAQAIARFRDAHPALAAVIESVVARCYYRDARVLASLGVEPRPPFPEGYTVEQGDWSLLDPVRARGPIYRDAG
ncbi:MAG: hypothetical protein NXH91_02320 [Phyllobacteriaceae bacterium]|nr:hypothetical protein [Phyllobacteriaceae bacterium]